MHKRRAVTARSVEAAAYASTGNAAVTARSVEAVACASTSDFAASIKSVVVWL